jgi:hypothetical protein
MGTAFSSSLLGLSGSLILGFLELQASQAHNRFYNELEEWLSGITELTPGSAGGDAANRQLFSALYDVQRSIAEIADRVQAGGGTGTGASADSMRELAQGVSQLVNQMRAEQTVIRQWVDEQSQQSAQVTRALEELARGLPRRSA